MCTFDYVIELHQLLKKYYPLILSMEIYDYYIERAC